MPLVTSKGAGNGAQWSPLACANGPQRDVPPMELWGGGGSACVSFEVWVGEKLLLLTA